MIGISWKIIIPSMRSWRVSSVGSIAAFGPRDPSLNPGKVMAIIIKFQSIIRTELAKVIQPYDKRNI